MTTLLTRVVAALFIAVGGLLIMGNHVCGCSLFLDPAPESELGRTLTAISRAQEEIHRRHGRFAESGAELMAELRRLRPPAPVRELEVQLLPPGEGYHVWFESVHGRRAAFCSITQMRAPGDRVAQLNVGCTG